MKATSSFSGPARLGPAAAGHRSAQGQGAAGRRAWPALCGGQRPLQHRLRHVPDRDVLREDARRHRADPAPDLADRGARPAQPRDAVREGRMPLYPAAGGRGARRAALFEPRELRAVLPRASTRASRASPGGTASPPRFHCHGPVRGIMADVWEMGYDLMEPFEPPPRGDVSIAEALEGAGGRGIVFGGVDDVLLQRGSARRFAPQCGAVSTRRRAPAGRSSSRRRPRPFSTRSAAGPKRTCCCSCGSGPAAETGWLGTPA